MSKWRRPSYHKERGLLITRLMKRDGAQCACGGYLDRHIEPEHEMSVTIDHVMPKSQGGADHFDNYRLMHRKCNNAKADVVYEALEEVS